MIEVAAGVLSDARGRVLLMQRKPGAHLAGLWEFPGGKLEHGESVEQALRRELREELGIEARTFEPLISLPWRYPEKTVRLHVLRVIDWIGEPQPREGHPLQWVSVDELKPQVMPAADRPVVAALRLPVLYAISPANLLEPVAALAWVRPLMADPRTPLLQLRLPQMSRANLRELVSSALSIAPSLRERLLINADLKLAHELGIGVHLRGPQLLRLQERPLPMRHWVSASCHNAEELERAAQIGADFATLSPVLATDSHPDAPSLGWPRFAKLTFAARLPVYALGGVGPRDLPHARVVGAQGVAGISAFACA